MVGFWQRLKRHSVIILWLAACWAACPMASASDILLWEDFESYDLGSWPSGWVRDANAWNPGNYIAADPAGSGRKTLKLFGQLHGYWGALAYYPCNWPEDFYVDARMYMASDVSGAPGAPGCRGFICMHQGEEWTNAGKRLIYFVGDQVWGHDEAQLGSVLGRFESNRWHDVRIHHRREGSTLTIQYWLDGVDLGKITGQQTVYYGGKYGIG